jgi:pyruvate/2-oxoglutarate dehydrogenase complex dihydrolipoamide acyltransferase (E2) component
MRYEAVVPDAADGALEVEIKEWIYKVGESVTKGCDMVEAITEKITLYIVAPADGTVAEILVPEGSKVPIGTVVGVVEGD